MGNYFGRVEQEQEQEPEPELEPEPEQGRTCIHCQKGISKYTVGTKGSTAMMVCDTCYKDYKFVFSKSPSQTNWNAVSQPISPIKSVER